LLLARLPILPPSLFAALLVAVGTAAAGQRRGSRQRASLRDADLCEDMLLKVQCRSNS